VLGLVLTAFILPMSTSLSLPEAFEKAKEESYRLRLSAVEIQKKGTQVKRARSEIFPELDAFGDWQWQDQSQSSDSSSVNRARSSQSIGLRARQSLFRGGESWAGLKWAREDAEIQRLLRREAELELLLQVSEIFYSLLSFNKENQSLQDQKNILEKRVNSLRRRAEIGRSQQVDLLAAQSQTAALNADLIENEFQRELLETQLCHLLSCETIPALRFEDWEAWIPQEFGELERKISEHYRMEIANRRVEQARAELRAQAANFLPELDLVGQYYLDRPRPLEDVSWSVQMNLNFNLFSAGRDWYQRQEAILTRQMAEIERAEEERLIRQDLKVSYDRWKRFETRLRALESAADLARRNADEQQKQYDLGLVSNLDVLNSLNQQLSSQRLADRALFDWRQAYVQMMVAAGRQP
jgi:outer membrane protein TolC